MKIPACLNWHSCGAYMAATLGVATWSYAPYAVFSIVSPLLTVAVAYAGFRMLRLPPTAAPAPMEATKSPGIPP
jgi:NhaC family Na+:H+ antiporter